MLRALAASLVVLLGVVAAAAYFSFFIVHVNEQAIVLEFGKPVRIINEPGLFWKIPVVQTVDYFDKRILDIDTAPQEVTGIGPKRIVVDTFARYRITDPLLFYQTIRDERNVRSRLGPITGSALRRVLGAATFQDVVRDKREALMKQIANQVNEEGKEFGLQVVDVRIKRADLPEQNSKNIFDRMRAERQREAAEFRAEGVGPARTAFGPMPIAKSPSSRRRRRARASGRVARAMPSAMPSSRMPSTATRISLPSIAACRPTRRASNRSDTRIAAGAG